MWRVVVAASLALAQSNDPSEFAAGPAPEDGLEANFSGFTVTVWETTGDAYQGVAVDEDSIYAVTNRRVTKMDKATGELLLQWDGELAFPNGHLASGAVVNLTGTPLLYCANSNWPAWPMASSVEIFDPDTMEHVDSFSFGIQLGSLTWLAWNPRDASWWGTFANYDHFQVGAMDSYGKGHYVQVARMDTSFQVQELFQIPRTVRATFQRMSNSGGSWGPDGFLYLSGHDLPQVYVLEKPLMGHTLHLVAVVDVPDISGQGIAWDWSASEPTLYGVHRPDTTVIVTRMPGFDLIQSVARPQAAGVVHENVTEFSSSAKKNATVGSTQNS